ncbi:DUF1444 family protein [Verrucomicrobium sp. BvORR034]|uniref:DUF1444 family protein n=1 Tax=Verrucomicrobium sp. BvORR034 TaxID=1396418 RepID=UPI000B30388E|nr:DUF1444 family protein [Verrucomicrobium sp. BvORR034]
MTPAEFTQEFVKTLQETRAELMVEVVQDLELRVSREGKSAVSSFLYNAYDVYKQDPSDKATVFERFILCSLDSLDLQDKKLDPTRIIPIVKDRAWIEETRQALASYGNGEAPEHIIEGLNDELVILYAEDTENNIRYLSLSDLAEAGMETWNLRELACENLERLIPEIKRHGENGVYMLTAGGTFEASLLLLDFVWKDPGLKVNGELVFAIPARDVLMITGREDPEGIARLRKVVADIFSKNGSYRLTQKLFLYHDGKFEVFEDRSNQTPGAQ